MKKKHSNRTRNIMYTQQIKHLPNGKSPDEIIDDIKKVLSPEKYAAIVHDKDVMDDGTPKEPHLHVMMTFKNPRSVDNIASLLDDKPQYFERFNQKAENGFAYLIHRTSKSRHKHQYDPNDVISNFNYTDTINTATEKVFNVEHYTSANKIKAILNLVYTGDMTKQEAISKLNGVEYANAKRKLNDVHERYLENEAAAFHEKMKSEQKSVEVIWIYGETGSGKSRLAKQIAEKRGKYYFSNTSTDPFQFYQGEHTIVLDELRPDTFKFSELLSILDPYSFGNIIAASRYSNKHIACDCFIITTPYSPQEFCLSMHLPLSRVDSKRQLYRRLTLVQHMSKQLISLMKLECGVYIPQKIIANPYSKDNTANVSNDSETLFNSINTL